MLDIPIQPVTDTFYARDWLGRAELLDGDGRDAFDRLTRLAASILDVPVAVLTLADAERQQLASSAGLHDGGHESPLVQSLSQQVSASGEPLLVADAQGRNGAAASASAVVAFAGVPLLAARGQVLGVLWVSDSRPREWSARDAAQLRDLAALAVTEIKLRIATRAATQHAADANQQREQNVDILESITDAFFTLDHAGNFLYLNREAEQLLERPRAALLGNNVWTEFPEAVTLPFYTAYQRALKEQVTTSVEAFYPPLQKWIAVRVYPTDHGASVYFQDATQQHAAEVALHASEERLRLAMDAARLGTWDWDIPSDTIIWSHNIELSLGLERGSFGGTIEAFRAFVHPDDGAMVTQAVQRALHEHAPYQLEFRMRGSDGLERWIATEGQVFYNADDVPVRMLGVYIDITRRKHTELALRQSQERFELVVETNDDGIMVMDSVGQITFANAAAERILGLTRSAITGRTYDAPAWNITAVDGGPFPHDQLPFVQAMRSVQPVHNVELAVVRPDGKRVFLSINAAPLQGEQIDGVVVTFSDISDYNRSEAVQRMLVQAGSVLAGTLDYDEMLARIVRLGVPELADWCTAHVVEDGRLLRCGIAHVDDAKEALIRATPYRRLVSLDSDHPIARVLHTGEPLLMADAWEEWMPTVDESVVQMLRELGFYSVMCVPLVARGRPLGVLQFVSGQSARRYSEADLVVAQELARRAALALDNARLYQEAQQALHARDDLFSMVTHDLKNPLTTITGYADVLQRRVKRLDLAEPERLLDGLGRMRQAANKMTQQLNELLDTAIIRSGGKLDLQCEYTDLIGLVRQTCAEQEPHVQHGDLQFESSDAKLIGQFDARRLERVFTNLIANAIKYSPVGGTITVALAHEQDADGDWAVVTIADQGIGIPEADLPHIFERFRRGSNVGGIKGNGIGLSTVASIVQQHGGVVAVESVAEQGTTFAVRLPLVARLEPEQAVQDAA